MAAIGQWHRGDAIKIMTFHAEKVMKSTADFKSVMTQKDRV
jgi:hypothetical protein